MARGDNAAMDRESAATPTVGLRSSAEITELLDAWKGGDPAAGDALMACVYSELRRLAVIQLGRSSCRSWQPTELVHELYLRLSPRREKLTFANRSHFFGLMARLLRDLTIDHARHEQRLKRGGATVLVSLSSNTGDPPARGSDPVDLLELGRALDRLGKIRENAVRVVELRYFAGLTIAETAAVMDLDRSTVVRTWRYARAWLRTALEEDFAKGQSR